MADISAFEVMVGEWEFSGDVTGHARFDWLPGKHFLRQHGTLTRDGVTHEAVEIIGAVKPFGATEPAAEITSRAYTDTGETLDYTYEIDGDTLTVWGGPKGSPAFSRAEFDAGRTVLSGAWQWPGGGYEFTMTKH
ncbi:hypothetical protein [Amycolatopsis suaedae]|uniref:DUF1579 domain-containing protein n=1 Tax=Amycolatopsis suaedae TaxID=2510978 RepID=A0A4Q7J555_9PSEU|nr:hypothetical protein [Amycolatopsis suaedae]RZQ61958.1 hypothetical protein EWH70_20315 [Amycolatopsis suaedae]